MKKFVYHLSVLFVAFVMLVTNIPVIGLADETKKDIDYNRGDIIGLGSYPQTEVTDESLKAVLTLKAGKTDNWTSYNYYINSEKSDFMKYTDIELDGEKYRGVYFASYRPTLTDGTCENNEQEDNGYSTSVIYWFKYEPLLWQILSYDRATDTAVVLSKSVIDSQEYYYDVFDSREIDGEIVHVNNYEHSDIRTWLNKSFYNTAFTVAEKKAVIATTLDNSACSTEYSQFDSNSTTDSVWLLSYAEAQNTDYGFVTDTTKTESRQAYATDYAKSQGVYTDSNGNYSVWHLRSASDYRQICVVGSNGCINNYSCKVDNTSVGVRPALTLCLKSEISPACIHSYVLDETVLPTCANRGYDQYRCTKCNKLGFRENYVAALGHDFINEAHVDSNGNYAFFCKTCNRYAVPANGDRFLSFGMYPQNEVADTELKSELTEKAGSTDTWTSYNYYQNHEKSDFMKYKDIELDGEKYRGVYFTSYRPFYTGIDVEYGLQDNNGYETSTIYWFAYEPVQWQILSYDADTDTAKMLCKFIMDSQEYYNSYEERTIDGKTVYPINYEYSNIRTWLNDNFYNAAFTVSEKNAIVETVLDNCAVSSDYSVNDGNSITDNVWLLSRNEAEEWLGIKNGDIDSNAQDTDYAKAQGDNPIVQWTLRSAGTDNYSAGVIYSSDEIKFTSQVSSTAAGIRPAISAHLYSGFDSSCSHKFTEKIIEPTCTVRGFTMYTCSVCGGEKTDLYKDALGHDCSGEICKNADGTISHKCIRCDVYGPDEKPVTEPTTAKTEEPTTKKTEPTTAKEESTTAKTEPTTAKEESTTVKSEQTTKTAAETTESVESKSLLDRVVSAVNGKKSGNKIAISVVGIKTDTLTKAIKNADLIDSEGNKINSVKPVATGMKIISDNEVVEIAVLGDIDSSGDISVSDARLALRAAVKLDTLTGVYEIAAEVGQGQISVSEARLVLRAAVKLDDPKDWLK